MTACFAVDKEVGDGKVFMLLRADTHEISSQLWVSDRAVHFSGLEGFNNFCLILSLARAKSKSDWSDSFADLGEDGGGYGSANDRWVPLVVAELPPFSRPPVRPLALSQATTPKANS